VKKIREKDEAKRVKDEGQWDNDHRGDGDGGGGDGGGVGGSSDGRGPLASPPRLISADRKKSVSQRTLTTASAMAWAVGVSERRSTPQTLLNKPPPPMFF
jgi:hypothetical protein